MGLLEGEGHKGEGRTPSTSVVITDWMQKFFEEKPTGSFTLRDIAEATGIKSDTVKNTMLFISGVEKTQKPGKSNVYNLIEGARIEFFQNGNFPKNPSLNYTKCSGLTGAYHSMIVPKR